MGYEESYKKYLLELQCFQYISHLLDPILIVVTSYYDKSYNSSFYQNLEKIQYHSALAITGVIRAASKEKLDLELGLESLGK